jgi:hypothetical protein
LPRAREFEWEFIRSTVYRKHSGCADATGEGTGGARSATFSLPGLVAGKRAYLDVLFAIYDCVDEAERLS